MYRDLRETGEKALAGFLRPKIVSPDLTPGRLKNQTARAYLQPVAVLLEGPLAALLLLHWRPHLLLAQHQVLKLQLLQQHLLQLAQAQQLVLQTLLPTLLSLARTLQLALVDWQMAYLSQAQLLLQLSPSQPGLLRLLLQQHSLLQQHQLLLYHQVLLHWHLPPQRWLLQQRQLLQQQQSLVHLLLS
jgi:hypothetical protein